MSYSPIGGHTVIAILEVSEFHSPPVVFFFVFVMYTVLMPDVCTLQFGTVALVFRVLECYHVL